MGITSYSTTVSLLLSSSELPTEKHIRDEIELLLHLDPVKYVDSKKLYLSGNYKNLVDYFKQYNLVDVRILMEAWENLAGLFYDTFNQNVLDSWSLPAVAQKILVSKYDSDSPPIFTFADKYGFLNKDLRHNLCGGFSGPLTLRYATKNIVCKSYYTFYRHVDLGDVDPTLDTSVYFNQDGEKFQKIVQYDANSLYPTVMLEEMPTGLGVFLRQSSSGLQPEVMQGKTRSNYSEISLEWIDMMQGES